MRQFIKNSLVVGLFVSLSFWLAGCAASGSVKETAPLNTKLGTYKNLLIDVSTTAPQGNEHLNEFKIILLKEATKTKLFPQFNVKDNTGKTGDLVLKLTITDVKIPEKKFISFTGQEPAEFVASVELIDVKAGNKKIGSFTAKGDSSKKKSQSYGGFKVEKSDAAEAMTGIAVHTFKYMQEHI